MGKTGKDLVKHLGDLAFATRLKRLAESLQSDVAKIYAEMEVDFEPKWFTMLYALYHNGTMSIVELSGLLKLTHPAILQFSEQMRAKKLVNVTKDKSDARKKLVVLTDKGRETFQQIEPVLREIELANAALLRETGVDVLRVVEQLEKKLEEKSMYQRITEGISSSFASKVEVLPYEPSLKKHFKSLNEEWLNKYFSIEPIDERMLSNPEREILQKDGQIFFAKHEGSIIGCVAVKRSGKDEFELLKMAVTEKVQSRGAGKILAQCAIAFAKKGKAKTLVLDTAAKLTKALRLYHSLGFKQVNEPASADYSRCTIKMKLSLNKR